MAQQALEQSIACNFITPGLAQAALILCLFEVSCHPEHAEWRVSATLQTLDNMVQALGLLDLDAQDPKVTRFGDHQVPIVHTPNHQGLLPSQPGSVDGPGYGKTSANEVVSEAGCSCAVYKIDSTSPGAAKSTPFWLSTPGWNPNWSLSDIRFEEQRRMVWSALTLSTAYNSYRNSFNTAPMDLGITKPWMYRILFPGETLYRGEDPRAINDVFPGSPSPKDSVWALYARSQLLFSACAHIKYSDALTDQEKAEFAVKAWLETERIEKSLNKHTCDVEKATMYHGREYLFNTQNLVSSQFSRHIPHPSIGDPSFHREKAVAWLSHQRRVANFLFGRLEAITGLQQHLLAKRPYFIFWFIGQISRYLNVWEQDHSLTMALDLCKSVLPALEYLMSIFPSAPQRELYLELHRRLDMACIIGNIPSPAAINLNVNVPVIL